MKFWKRCFLTLPNYMVTHPVCIHSAVRSARGFATRASRWRRFWAHLPEEIVFTSCGTESDNSAIRSALLTRPDKKHIVISRVEHPAIRALCSHLGTQGYKITELPVDKNGILDLENLEKSLTPDTAIVSLMWGNNETGVIFPVEEAARMAHEKGILFHTDAVQTAGKIPINMKNNVIDMLSISGHKLHAPKGIGILYIRRGTKFSPFLIGGHQEKGRRGGTENTAGIIGLGKACELAAKNMDRENIRVKRLRDKLEQELLKKIPQQPCQWRYPESSAQYNQHQF